MFKRGRKSKKVMVGDVGIGGDSPISVQSMTNTKTYDIESTVKQIHTLEEAGCDIIRVAVPDMESAYAISNIKSKINIPLVADVHFDFRLAIESIKQVQMLSELILAISEMLIKYERSLKWQNLIKHP